MYFVSHKSYVGMVWEGNPAYMCNHRTVTVAYQCHIQVRQRGSSTLEPLRRLGNQDINGCSWTLFEVHNLLHLQFSNLNIISFLRVGSLCDQNQVPGHGISELSGCCWALPSNSPYMFCFSYTDTYDLLLFSHALLKTSPIAAIAFVYVVLHRCIPYGRFTATF